MILYEFEGKKILAEYGVLIPKSSVVNSENEKITIKALYFKRSGSFGQT